MYPAAETGVISLYPISDFMHTYSYASYILHMRTAVMFFKFISCDMDE